MPGTIGGWAIALELSAALGGRLPLKILLERASRLAREGVAVSPSETRFDPLAHPALVAAPGFARTYLVDGKPAPAGEIRKLTSLADTLDQLAHAGLDDFYRGDVAREIAADLERLGSPVTRADLKAYRARWREPLSLRLKNATLYNTPAPTQGLASLMMLGIYERLAPRGVDGFEHAHALIEGFKRALAVRDRVCVDFDIATDDFARAAVAGVPRRRGRRRSSKTRAPRLAAAKADKGDTVWMGAIDNDGLAVSFIQSVYWEYGSGCVLARTGVTMHNRGLAFSLDPKSPPCAAARAAAVPHAQPAARRVRRRARAVLRLDGRRRAAAVPGAGVHAHRGRRQPRRRGRRAAPSLRAAPGARRASRSRWRRPTTTPSRARSRGRATRSSARPRSNATCSAMPGR